jgi:putative FmdB family regulatory protein
MPRYDYKCKVCGTHEIIAHGFHADETHDCPTKSCKGIMSKVISPTPAHFKGSGFYKTDNR